MADKQIIIDGVNVRGCKHFKIGTCLADYLLTDMAFDEAKCELCKDCYYKQLKHKEQECQQAMDNYVQLDLQRVKEYNELVDLYKAKEQECEELKKYEYHYLDKFLKLKDCLTEIKEIAEPYKMTIKKRCGNCKKYDDCHACCYEDINCYKYTSPKTVACEEFTYLDKFIPNILANNILQKISEVEE